MIAVVPHCATPHHTKRHVYAHSSCVQVPLSGPLAKSSLRTTASFEVRSPKRLQLRLTSGAVATPELTGNLQLPDSLSVLGQNIDLSQVGAGCVCGKGEGRGDQGTYTSAHPTWTKTIR
jgi:hypothetical protein